MNKQPKIAALVGLVFAALVYLFAWSPIFTVSSIEVTGIPQSLSQAEIVEKSGIEVGERLARIEPRAATNSLKEFSWVKSADVSRNWWSGKVLIAISKRVPVALYKGQALDNSGEVFDLPPKTPQGLPLVTASHPTLGLEAIKVFTALPGDLRSNLLSLNASNSSSISSWQLISGRKVKVMWGSAQQLDLKVTVYRALLKLPENSNIKRMDLSAPHAPIVK